ncbi:unnamed protein product [Onchocerca ochengi]|uniref:Methyl-accepting chemotaxis protein n=1 Tax=Onchocerca ochengi TaxID=42157 RepID=A0A182ED56_ONCOC|nr:unnamed protein product [Onchocerca ochengi]
MDHGFGSEEPYSGILPRAEEFAESAVEKVSDVAKAGAAKVMDVAGKTVDDVSKRAGEVLDDTVHLFGDKIKETGGQIRDMEHRAMETTKDTASNILSGAVHEISGAAQEVRNMGADIIHSLDEGTNKAIHSAKGEFDDVTRDILDTAHRATDTLKQKTEIVSDIFKEHDVGHHTAFQQPTHDAPQIIDDPSQQWGKNLDWRQYANKAADIDLRHPDFESGNTMRDEIINAHDQIDSMIANMHGASAPQYHAKLNAHLLNIIYVSDDSSAEESMLDRKGPLTIPHQVPEDIIQFDRDFDSPKQSGFEVAPRPPTPPKALDDEDVKPTTIDLGQTGVDLLTVSNTMR